MKSVILFVAAAFCYAAAVDDVIPIVKQSSDINPDGSYEHSFEGGNGIKVEEHGVLKNAGNADNEIQEATGSFEYTDNEGTKFTVHYVANENGFQPEGAHLPVAPEIPAAIQRALDWIAAHPEPAGKAK